MICPEPIERTELGRWDLSGTTTIGTARVKASRLKSSHNEKPSTNGSRVSVITSAGCWMKHCTSASRPSAATAISNGRRRRASQYRLLVSSSASAITTRRAGSAWRRRLVLFIWRCPAGNLRNISRLVCWTRDTRARSLLNEADNNRQGSSARIRSESCSQAGEHREGGRELVRSGTPRCTSSIADVHGSPSRRQCPRYRFQITQEGFTHGRIRYAPRRVSR